MACPAPTLSDRYVHSSSTARGRETTLSESKASPVSTRSRQPSLSIDMTEAGLCVQTTSTSPVWTEWLFERLDHLLSLQPGWDSYRAEAIAFDAAVALIRLVADYCDNRTLRPSVVPTTQGGLQIEWHTPLCELEIEFDNVGGCGLLAGAADGEPIEAEAPTSIELAKWLARCGAEVQR